MATPILIYPGAVGPRVRLLDCLREMHEAAAVARLEEIKRRSLIGVPLNDEVSPEAIAARVRGAAERFAANEWIEGRRELADVYAATSGTLEPLGPFVAPDVDGVESLEVRFVAVSASARMAGGDAVSRAWEAWSKARKNKSGGEAVCMEAMQAAQANLVRSGVAEVGPFDVGNGACVYMKAEDGLLPAQDVEALRMLGLMDFIYSATQAFQALSPGKGLRFGLSAASTSQSSIAPSAPAQGASSSGATATHLQGPTETRPISQGPSTPTTHAPAGI